MRAIKIISCGPGGEDFITMHAIKQIALCDVFIGSERLLSSFAPRDKKRIAFSGKTDNLKDTLEANKGKTIAILVTGDSGIYSLSKKILQLIEDQKVEIVPGISSLQVAFARIKESWENVDTFTFHGRTFQKREEILHSDKAVIFCDRNNSAKRLLEKLFHNGIDRKCYIFQNLTLKTEKIIEVKSHADIADVEEVSTELLVLLK